MLAVQQSNVEITPDNLTEAQDQLLAAGSRISFRDIYNQEIDIPLHKGKFYMASDVDNLFILINGVLTDVSEHAHRSSKALAESRAETQKLQEELQQAAGLFEELDSQNQALEAHLNTLITSMSENSVQNEQVEALVSENQSLSDKLNQIENESQVLKDTLTATRNKYNDAVNDVEKLRSDLIDVQEAYSRLIEDTSNSNNDSLDELQKNNHLLTERNKMLQKLSTIR